MKVIVNELTFYYPGRTTAVFDSFSYELDKGITLIKGFSGCGKSTLLRLIAGYLLPSKGKIITDSPYKVGSILYLRKEVGMLFQQMNLLPLASVERNLELAVKGSRGDIEGCHNWLEILGLEPLSKQKPSQLSGGQLQRAGLARCLSKKPNILLLDEPTSGLDDLNTKIICKALANNLPESVMCCIATHDSRLDEISNNVVDFNNFLPVEEHLKALV